MRFCQLLLVFPGLLEFFVESPAGIFDYSLVLSCSSYSVSGLTSRSLIRFQLISVIIIVLLHVLVYIHQVHSSKEIFPKNTFI